MLKQLNLKIRSVIFTTDLIFLSIAEKKLAFDLGILI